MAGSLAGMAYWGVPYPADVVKSKIQTGTHGLVTVDGAQPSIAAVARQTLRTEGVRGFYRGCGITVARAGPGNGEFSAIGRSQRMFAGWVVLLAVADCEAYPLMR